MDGRRGLPSVAALLELDTVKQLAQLQSHASVANAARRAVASVRDGLLAYPEHGAEWADRVADELAKRNEPALRRVLNATGVVLHTNLGRAPLAPEAVAAIRMIAEDYSDLEYDLDTGKRGARDVHTAALLCELTGAEDALVVNNCAAALTLALHALAPGGDVAVSRGELVEIGGSFRIPDVMASAGVHLVEVGTTNRTHGADYESAIDSGACAIVKVHRSNFRIDGFTSGVTLRELATLCAARGIPLIHDFGSGLLTRLDHFGLTGEPMASELVTSGASVVVMSGDKLLGGPQAGIALGSRDAIARMRRHPFARAVRVDKLTIAALFATLQLYRDEDSVVDRVPILRMLTAPLAQLEERASALADRLRHAHVGATVVQTAGAVGAGAFPAVEIPSAGLALAGDPMVNEKLLRTQALPVISRISDGAAILNLRSVPEADDDVLGDTVAAALSQ